MNQSLPNNNIYLYKTISNNAIAAYFVALFAVSIFFMKHSIAWYFMLFGVLEVVVFYYYGNTLSKKYIKYTGNTVTKKIFVTALIIRIVYVMFSYWFYDFMTGSHLEFNAADSTFYHGTALYLSEMISKGHYNLLSIMKSWDIELSDSGYVIYLGYVYWLFFDSILVSRLLKALMSAYMCVLIYKLAKRNFGEHVGRLTAVLALLCPQFIFYCGLQLKETEMIFVTMLAIEKFDAAFSGGKITLKMLVLPFLMLVLVFTMRTALGISLMFAVMANVLLSDKSVVSTSRKWLISIALAVVAVTFLWNAIVPEIEEMWARRNGQKANMEWRAQRNNGNKFAKYAGAAVFAPLIFSLPFPTMVDIPSQETHQMMNGNNFVKNIFSFFTIYALIMILFKHKTWQKYTLILGFMIAYLGILSLSAFAQSERFHLPVLPVELIFVAFGISLATTKTKKYFNIWCIFMVIVTIVWNWFKLAGRGMI
jgi:hypothetical protein